MGIVKFCCLKTHSLVAVLHKAAYVVERNVPCWIKDLACVFFVFLLEVFLTR